MNKKYIAKANTWFKEGTEAHREEEILPDSAIYRGIYVVGSEPCDDYWHKKGYKKGDDVEISEHCNDDEFIIVEQQ